MEKIIHVYCDGGSRGNPGDAASAFIVLGEKGEILAKRGMFLGYATNNQAEYKAVLSAFSFLAKRPFLFSRVLFFLDSELVAKQLKAEYRIRDKKLQALAMSIKGYERSLGFPVSYYFIPREENKLADSLVNQVLDEKKDIY